MAIWSDGASTPTMRRIELFADGHKRLGLECALPGDNRRLSAWRVGLVVFDSPEPNVVSDARSGSERLVVAIDDQGRDLDVDLLVFRSPDDRADWPPTLPVNGEVRRPTDRTRRWDGRDRNRESHFRREFWRVGE